MELARSFGFNGVRLHQKPEDPRFLYWADRLGLLVWAEMPSPAGFSERATRRLIAEWQEIIERDRSHPCVVAWVPFNESWGVTAMSSNPAQRHLVASVYPLTRSLDPTRPVISNDGWEHADSDIWTVHDYAPTGRSLAGRYGTRAAIAQALGDRWPGPRRVVLGESAGRGQPVVLSEFGGVTYAPEDGDVWLAYGTAPTAEEIELLQCLADSTAVAMENVRVYETLETERAETLNRLALVAEYRDDDTFHHTRRVARTAYFLATQLGLDSNSASLIRQAAPLHDIGKLAVSDAILLKPGRLDRDEMRQVRGHVAAGAEILAGSHSEVLRVAEEIALTHHEWWDGSGYPAGTAGEAIPLSGRIVALADVFDALTHARPYKPAWPLPKIFRLTKGGKLNEGIFKGETINTPSMLAVEDALKAHQRPKLERYDDSIFLTLKTLWYVDEDDQVETGEINLFVGRDFVNTWMGARIAPAGDPTPWFDFSTYNAAIKAVWGANYADHIWYYPPHLLLLPWPVENTVYHDAAHPSHLLLPVIPDAPEIKPVAPPLADINWPLAPGAWMPNTEGWPLTGE